MLFNSYAFILVFLPVTLAVYLGIVRLGWRNRSFDWLVLASLFFYGWWNWANVPLLVGSLLFNYVVGTGLGKLTAGRRAKALLVAGLTANLLFLGYFKYANFTVDNLNVVLGTDWHLARVLLPLGISFYTFQKVAYLVDSYNGLTRGYGFRDFCLFVSFFPQLIAGPIVHHSEVMPQFRRPNWGPTWDDWSVAWTLFTLGLAKKVLVADQFATYANPLFNAARDGGTVGFAGAWVGVLAYTMQIYFDFSGYTDMAIGLGRLFGIRLPLNFNSPYKAANIADFWRRWHMTLSRFLRDYLYIPLGGNRQGPARRYVNLMLTMLLGGFWHGAGWTYVIWGALHGLYLSVFHAFATWRQPRSDAARSDGSTGWLGQWSGRLLTFLAVLLAWVFFRADSVGSAWRVLTAMSGSGGFGGEILRLDLAGGTRLGVCFLAVVWFCPNSHEILAAHEPALEYGRAGGVRLGPTPAWLARRLAWRPTRGWAWLLAGLMLWAMLFLARPSEFIYWQF